MAVLNRTRLLLVVNVDWFFISHRLPLARAAAAQGFEVHVATTVTSNEHRRTIESAGMTLHGLNFDRSGSIIVKELRTLWSVRRLYRTVRPAIVHLVTIKPVIYGGIMSRLCGVPAMAAAIPGLGYVFSKPGITGRMVRAIVIACYRAALNHANSRVIFQNVEQHEMFLSRGIVRDGQAVLIRGSGVDLKKFAVVPEPPGTIRVVLPSRMLREKGIVEFYEAARQIRSRAIDAEFLLAGDVDRDNPGSVPASLLAEWDRSGAVKWVGFSEDMPSLLSSCHIVCLPSHGEGLPKALLEAAACGRAIVTTDIPGCRDVGRDGYNALLVPVGDSSALAEALLKLIVDPDLRRKFGVNGRKLAEQEFSEESIVDQTLDVYRGLMAHA